MYSPDEPSSKCPIVTPALKCQFPSKTDAPKEHKQEVDAVLKDTINDTLNTNMSVSPPMPAVKEPDDRVTKIFVFKENESAAPIDWEMKFNRDRLEDIAWELSQEEDQDLDIKIIKKQSHSATVEISQNRFFGARISLSLRDEVGMYIRRMIDVPCPHR